MIKKILLASACLSFISLFSQSGNVGINTSTPEEKLHVNGSMRFRDGVEVVQPFSKLDATEGYSFLIKSPQTATEPNKITSYNQTFFPTTPAPINLIQFKINCDLDDNDWVNEYDTKINAEKFLVIISSFGYNLPTYNSSTTMTPIPQIYAYTKPGGSTWFVKADYESSTPLDQATQGEWTLNLLVFDRAYAKEINSNVDLNGATTGASTLPIVE